MINIRVRAFHMDRLPRCEHGRVLCTSCGLDPFDTPKPRSHHLPHADCAEMAGAGVGTVHGGDQ